MSVSCYVGTFVQRSGTGTQAVTGVGFTPKVLLFWGTNSGVTTFEDVARFHFGFDDGTNAKAVAHFTDDAVATADMCRAWRSTKSFVINNANQTTDSEGSIQSLDADGFTFNWTTNAGGGGGGIHFLAIGGSDVSAKVGEFTASASTGDQVVTGIGFQPDVVILLGAAWTTSSPSTTDEYGPIAFGWMTSDAQGAATANAIDNVNPSNTARCQRTDRCLFRLNGSNNGFVMEGARTSLNGDGFTINWTDPQNGKVAYLALRGVSAAVGSLTQPTSPGVQSVSVPTLTPQAVLFLSTNKTASTSIATEHRWSFGGSDGTRQVCSWAGDNNSKSPTETARYHSTTQAIALATPAATGASSTLDAAATVTDLASGSFELTWSDADATAREVLYLALSAQDAPNTYTDGDPGPLVITTLLDRADIAHPFAAVDLNDRGVYYDGYKEPRSLSHRPIVRALSGAKGEIEHPDFGVTLSDTDRLLRGLLDDDTTKYLTNCPLIIRTVSDEDRRAELPQHVEIAGYVSEYSPQESFRFQFVGADWLKQRLARRTQAPEFWQILLTKDDWPLLPDPVVNQAAPLLYGRVSDEVDLGSPDVPADLYPRGTFDPGWIAFNRHGWGSGSFSPGIVYIWVTFIKDGVESTVVAGQTSFLMSVPSPATQVKFRCAAVPDLFRIYVTDGGDFHPFSNPLGGTYARYVDFDPADIPEGNNPFAGPDPADAFNRFALIDSPTQGGDYHALVSDGGGGSIQAAKGAWPTLYVGEETYGDVTRSAFVVCFGAISNILGVFVGGVRQTSVGSSTEIECPFLGDYTSVFGGNYRTINDRRWTVVYATGTVAVNAINGSAPIWVNAHGYEDIGDTSGDLIDSPVRIHQHFTRNFLATDTPVTGDWLSASPTLPTGAPMIDDDSYDTVDSELSGRVSGGYEAAGGISVGGAFENALDILASLQRDGDFGAGTNRQGGVMVSFEPDASPVSATKLTDVLDIVDGSFSARTELSQNFWNVIPFTHTQDYTEQTETGWFLRGEVRDDASITNYGQERTADVWPMRWLRSSTARGSDTIIDVAQRFRLRYRHPLRAVKLTVPYLTGAGVELGDVIRLDHAEGIGASGWADHDVRVIRIQTDLDQLTRAFECYDLQPIYDGLDDAVEPTSSSTGLRTDTITSLQERVTTTQADVTTLQAEVVALDAEIANFVTGPPGGGSPSSPAATDKGLVRFDGDTGLLVQDTAGPIGEDDGRISHVTTPTNASDVATKGYVDSLALGGGAVGSWKFALKTSDESVTSSTALQDDNELFVAIGASETWVFRVVMVYTAAADAVNGKIKVAMTVPTSATVQWSVMGKNGSETTNSGGFSTNTSGTSGTSAGNHGGAGATLMHIVVDGVVVNSTNAGNVQVQWAQNASSGTATVVKTSSFLMAWRVA